MVSQPAAAQDSESRMEENPAGFGKLNSMKRALSSSRRATTRIACTFRVSGPESWICSMPGISRAVKRILPYPRQMHLNLLSDNHFFRRAGFCSHQREPEPEDRSLSDSGFEVQRTVMPLSSLEGMGETHATAIFFGRKV